MAAKASSLDSFPFFFLPYELRIKILSYSDLVTPLASVKWDPYNKYHLGIERVQSCHLRNGTVCGPPYDQCHPDHHAKCRGRLRPADDDAATEYHDCNGREYCPCPHASEARARMGMTSCRRCTHYACQFLPASEKNCNASVHWTPPVGLFLVSRTFKNISSAVFFGCNHFQVSCGNPKASRSLVDWNDYCKRSTVDSETLLPPSPSRAGPSIFLCDIVPKDARHFLQSLEIDLSGIANYAAMQNWLRVALEIGPQLRLKVLRLHGESPVDGLQDVAGWRHGQDAAECARLAREEVAAWMWPPLKEGAVAVVDATAGGQRTAGKKLELFEARISCASSSIHGDSVDTVWYSIVDAATVTANESLPYWCHGLYYDHGSVFPDWSYNVRIHVEMPPSAAEMCLNSKLGSLDRERWVEGVLVTSWKPDHGLSSGDSDHAE